MCGVAGYFAPPGSHPDEPTLRKMTDSLTHRGPDGGGYEVFGSAALGHRRLSILDLSAAAAQPMRSHNGRYSIVYNGEVFNFSEIAHRLGNVQFRSTGDTEVILEAFVQWGPDFVKELNGMFAIAIHDQTNERESGLIA